MLLKNTCIVLCIFYVTITKGDSTCTTPNGEKAACISLLSCPVLLEAVNKDLISKQFVNASACGTGPLMVCCGKTGNFTQSQEATEEPLNSLNESSREYVLRNQLLPTKLFCGLQHTDDYFYNETETSVDEFPWLVYFVIPENYINNYYLRKESNCVGVLISDRYVLTSYWDCYRYTVRPGINHTIQMMIGQHHIYKDVSCIHTKYEVDDCTHPVLHVESLVWYTAPSFFSFKIMSRFGISILRLRKKIDFSDYVRPICLPLNSEDMPKTPDIIFGSGWGEQTSVDGKNVKLKKRVSYTVMDKEECEFGNPVLTPICGVPLASNTDYYVCPADNGGPLMYKHGANWFVGAIIANTTTCDDVHPVIGERLTPEAIDWILDAIAFFEKKFIVDTYDYSK